jgi:ribose transport system ATP-binding protein
MGRRVDVLTRRAGPSTGRAPLLEVERLRGGAVHSADLRVRVGEIVGVAGLLGSGRSTLLRLLFGAQHPTGGTITLDGCSCAFRSPRDAMAAGVAYVPEDRAADAAFPDLSVSENLSISVCGDYFRGGRLRTQAERADSRRLLLDYQVKAESPRSPLSTLSGGNQQKAILARWLRRSPRLLLLDEPTQGVDVGARLEIWSLVQRAASAGCGVLVVSSDMEELPLVCDRVVVLRAGTVVNEVDHDDLTAATLDELMLEVPA